MGESAGIEIALNGDPYRIATGSTIRDLLKELSLDTARIAVEHNLKVVPRAEHGGLLLSAGDTLEIVTFVGGG